MRKSEGKFILFDVAEFSEWLDSIVVNRVIHLLQNHHTWSPSYKDFHDNNHFQLLKGMENAHVERGFAEIAQNFTTFPDGTIAACRSIEKIPAGIKGANAYGTCIENLGNFDIEKDRISQEQRDAIIKINALLCKKFSLASNENTIVYHHWYDLDTGQRTDGAGNTKTCPGSDFFKGNKPSDALSNFIPFIGRELEAEKRVTPIVSGDVLFAARVTCATLNVRDQPSASGIKLKQLNRGVIVKAFEQQGNWCRIHPTGFHWVNAKYLERVPI